MKMQEIVNLIFVRDFMTRNLDNIYFKMNREEIKTMQSKMSEIDRLLIKELSNLKLDTITESQKKINEDKK